MVDSYPDAPGHRMAYDLWATQIWHYNTVASMTQLASSNITKLNNEENVSNIISNGHITQSRYTEVLFNRAMDIHGVWTAGWQGDLDVSDGLFDDIATISSPSVAGAGAWSGSIDHLTNNAHYVTWRETDEMAIFSAEGVWGLRGRMDDAGLVADAHLRQLHIYASPNPEANPDRLVLIDDDTGMELASVLDFGDTNRGNVHSHTFQVMNNSATHTAENVTLDFHSLNSGVASWFEFRDGVGAWSTSLALGNIGAGATYGNDIDVRVTIASTAGLGPRSNRILLNMTGWST